MPTYENTLTLAIGCSLTSVGNQTFAARQVSNLLEPSHGPKGLTPEITMTLVPEQTLKGVLTDIINTLVPEQTLTSNIKCKTVSSVLVPVQTVVSRTKNGTNVTTLEPTQTINTSASILSNASRSTKSVRLGLSVGDGGTFRKTVSTTLVPRQGIIGYAPSVMTLGSVRYVTKNVAAN